MNGKMYKLKVIVVGPKEVGKTLISNIFADMSDTMLTQYEPTEGVRILEVEAPVTPNSGITSNVEIEVWDCSGSHKYQSCWPVIQLNAHGVVFVCNPNVSEQIQELELLYDYFITQNGLNERNCLVFINSKTTKLQISNKLFLQESQRPTEEVRKSKHRNLE